MKVTILPSRAAGTVYAPPSKSIAHRALICGALTKGCTIENCGYSQDIEATLRCLQALGATVERRENTVIIGEFDPFSIPDHPILDCGESGSTLRFLLPLCLLSGKPVTLIGHGRLMERPMEIYETLCREHNWRYEKHENAITVCGTMKSGTYSIPGNVSSQFITGLLFALSLVSGKSRVEVTENYESVSYVTITKEVLSAFGISILQQDNTYYLDGNAHYSCANFTVEGDYSNAAFLDAFNLLSGDVKVLGLSTVTPQGDWVYKKLFADLSSGIRGFNLTDCPDLGPVMFALAATFGGAEFTGTARLRIKESDRIGAMTAELSKFGISAEVGENFVRILPGTLNAPTEILSSHNDHRIVMALCILCSLTGGTIDGAEAVAKSYPNYFEDIASIGINVIY